METLPIEMVEMIAHYLTPQDLARCSAVSRNWHDTFNHDCIWKRHVDVELEEPLRTNPCAATPAFVAPEEDSTLSPICHWKLAFMRETHLWKNWRNKEIMKYKKENIIKFRDKNSLGVDFLTDSIIVIWYFNSIEIWDVNVMPSVFVAKTDTSVTINEHDKRRVIGTDVLVVEKSESIEVYKVDIAKKSITVRLFPFLSHRLRVFKENFCFCKGEDESTFIIFDVNTGNIVKEEPCPVGVKKTEYVELGRIISSPSSDFVAVEFEFYTKKKRNITSHNCSKYFIYNIKQLAFLPGSGIGDAFDVVLHGHWMAVSDRTTLKVYNFQTGEVLMGDEISITSAQIKLCYSGFVFVDYYDSEEGKSQLRMYFPFSRTLTTVTSDKLFDTPGNEIEIINNKFIALFVGPNKFSKRVWKPSNETVEKCNIFVMVGCTINRSFTKVINKVYLNSSYPTWYISYLW